MKYTLVWLQWFWRVCSHEEKPKQLIQSQAATPQSLSSKSCFIQSWWLMLLIDNDFLLYWLPVFSPCALKPWSAYLCWSRQRPWRTQRSPPKTWSRDKLSWSRPCSTWWYLHPAAGDTESHFKTFNRNSCNLATVKKLCTELSEIFFISTVKLCLWHCIHTLKYWIK